MSTDYAGGRARSRGWLRSSVIAASPFPHQDATRKIWTQSAANPSRDAINEGMKTLLNAPSSPSVAEATEAVQRATAAVDDALMTDGDAFKARLDLRAAEEALQQANARQQAVDRAAAAQARRAEQQVIADQASNTQEAFEQAVSIIEPVEGVAFDAPVLPPAVAAAAADLARAQAALTAAHPALTAANATRAAVSNRIAPKVARLAEIAARRADGDERDGDAAEVSLLEQDLAHLNVKLAPLQAPVAEALAVVAQRREVIGQFEHALKVAQRKAELDEMVNRVRALEGHFCAAVRALRLAAEARGSNNFASTFLPSKTLRDISIGARV